MTPSLKEIFAPTLTKVGLAVIFTIFLHFYLIAESVRQSTHTELQEVRSFWLTNFINSLPYLQTDNVFLKFATFFIGSYIVVWLVTAGFRLLDNLQVLIVKKLRRRT